MKLLKIIFLSTFIISTSVSCNNTSESSSISDVVSEVYYSEGLEFKYETSDGPSYWLVGVGTCQDSIIYVPPTYNNLPVTRIAKHAFYECDFITSVVISGDLFAIYDGAFTHSSIKEVVIQGNVNQLSGFKYCSLLTDVGISGEVKYLLSAFSNCYSLVNVTLPEGLLHIGHQSFKLCKSLKQIDIPDSVNTISFSAFENCVSLEKITLPLPLKELGRNAFENCTSLKSVTLKENLRLIMNDAFAGCTSLTDVYFEGTREQFEQITIFEGNDCLLNANIHFI